jgi:signal transduction histidine kinase
MLVNLLSNAVKFTPNGGHVRLGAAVDLGARLIHFAVQDDGPGIAPADQARLFQPFIQLDSQLSRQHEGTGLGLALVKRLAEQHGGTVRLDSSGVPGEGCRFIITLPA